MKKECCLIQDVFAESKFKLFKNYSIEHQLIYLQDISPEILVNFAQQRGVGAVKMTALIERLAAPVSTLPLDVFIAE